MVTSKASIYYFIIIVSGTVTLGLLFKFNGFGQRKIIVFGSNSIFNPLSKEPELNHVIKSEISTPGRIIETPTPRRPIFRSGIEGIKKAAAANYNYFHLKAYFDCPDVGQFGVKGTGHCSNFFDCERAGGKMESMSQCKQPGRAFNRLSRTCEKAEYVKCDWCEVQGRFADITSNKHFIECFPGNIAIRYKCKFGVYDRMTRLCHVSSGTGITNWKIAVIDPPPDIVAFMNYWIMIEQSSPARLIQNVTIGTNRRTKLTAVKRLHKFNRKIRSIRNSKRNTEAKPADEETGENGQDDQDQNEALNAFIAKQFGAKKKVYDNWNGTLAAGDSKP